MAYCKTCWNRYQSEYRKRRYAEEPEYRRKAIATNRERLYGVSEDRYTELYAQQGGVCAICLLDERDGGNLAVDHDHASGVIRGLLCRPCNRGLGMLQDDRRLLVRAAEYLSSVTS